ncbi:hypothetical protein [Arthrobacter livingstonensis]|uniref:hypothetical protein n=1 Tax=Arthrobacter livingstonensis TaxID=670078 RepID=UPI00147398D2|nr:hypothetical protein [Arthrobacter livingstonensis]
MPGLTVRYVPSRFHAAISGWSEATMADNTQILVPLTHGAAEAVRPGLKNRAA